MNITNVTINYINPEVKDNFRPDSSAVLNNFKTL